MNKINILNSDESAINILKSYGVNHNLSAKVISRFWGNIEPPVRISESRIFHDFSIGAFSYISGGFFYHTHVGRYCSLANQLHIGQSNHPTDWLSTHPFQYQSGLFELREDFEFKEEYDADRNMHIKNADLPRPKPTRIGNDCWIATGVYIKNGITIGDGAVIGARSVVTKDIPPYSIAVGSPARVIRYRFDDNLINNLLKIKWWQFAPWQLRGIDFSKPAHAIEQLESLISNGIKPYKPNVITIKRC